MPKKDFVEEYEDLFVEEIVWFPGVGDGPIEKTSSRSFYYFRQYPNEVMVELNLIKGSSEREESDEGSRDDLIFAPRGKLNLSAEVDDVREVIPDDLFS